MRLLRDSFVGLGLLQADGPQPHRPRGPGLLTAVAMLLGVGLALAVLAMLGVALTAGDWAVAIAGAVGAVAIGSVGARLRGSTD